MGAEPKQLHVALFPFMAHGHMIPIFDIAILFTSRNVKTTIITTPLNAPTFTTSIDNPSIEIELFRFPGQESGLPEGCENIGQAVGPEMIKRFFKAIELLREQLEQYLNRIRPNCLIADMFFPWATESASKFNIPRFVFHGTSNFTNCASEIMRLYQPCTRVSSDEEQFVLPRLPHQVKMTRLQFTDDERKIEETESKMKFREIKESEVKSFGVIVNSFYELEPDYADLYRNELGRKSWLIGPVSICRGKKCSIDENECLKWLNSKKVASVIYICFGSTAKLRGAQLYEIAMALEASRHDFICVIRGEDDPKEEELLPPGFEHTMKVTGKGMIIRGWVPQVMILEHEAIGGFVTHCGWNSTLEGISAGTPMVTWPVFADQFFNEKLVTDILKIGVPVGAKKWSLGGSSEDDIMKRGDIEKAIRDIMVGDEAEERRCRARKLKEMAWKAVEEDGSSFSDLNSLINELRTYHAQ